MTIQAVRMRFRDLPWTASVLILCAIAATWGVHAAAADDAAIQRAGRAMASPMPAEALAEAIRSNVGTRHCTDDALRDHVAILERAAADAERRGDLDQARALAVRAAWKSLWAARRPGIAPSEVAVDQARIRRLDLGQSAIHDLTARMGTGSGERETMAAWNLRGSVSVVDDATVGIRGSAWMLALGDPLRHLLIGCAFIALVWWFAAGGPDRRVEPVGSPAAA